MKAHLTCLLACTLFFSASISRLRAQTISVADALDTTNLVWTVSTTYDHVARTITQNTNTSDGVDAVEFVTQSQYGGAPLYLISAPVIGPGTVTFWCQTTSGEVISGASYMSCGIRFPEGNYTTSYAFTGPWQRNSCRVGAGYHILCWGVGLTTAVPVQNMFLDQVTFTPDPAPPVFLSQPQPQRGRLGSKITFCVVALSYVPPSYQWLKNGLPLTDDGRIAGATSDKLTLNSLQVSDVASYSVRVSNDLGITNSATAVLSLDPSLTGNDPSIGFRSNRFGFNIYGRSGATAVLEGSTNLTHWIPIFTNVLGPEPFYFSDPDCEGKVSRWYRVR